MKFKWVGKRKHATTFAGPLKEKMNILTAKIIITELLYLYLFKIIHYFNASDIKLSAVIKCVLMLNFIN